MGPSESTGKKVRAVTSKNGPKKEPDEQRTFGRQLSNRQVAGNPLAAAFPVDGEPPPTRPSGVFGVLSR
jgi:hypothetical protein